MLKYASDLDNICLESWHVYALSMPQDAPGHHAEKLTWIP